MPRDRRGARPRVSGRTDSAADRAAWLRGRPSLAELRDTYPEEWEAVERELAATLGSGTPDALQRYLAVLSGPAPPGSDFAAAVRRQMAASALRGHYLAHAAGTRDGRIRLGLLNGWVLQRLLFARGLERRPVSLRAFRLVWPLVWQRRRLLPLVQPKGVYCFYSAELVERLAAMVGDGPCLEIAAGDGTLARFLNGRGVGVVATDDHSWSHAVQYGSDVIRQDAREALRAHRPRVVLCSWPPAGNTFERHVFRTASVELYIVISSRHAFAAGNWDDYRAQDAFELVEDASLSRLVLPPELESAVYVFRRIPR